MKGLITAKHLDAESQNEFYGVSNLILENVQINGKENTKYE